jgi:hypothetical protein
LSGLPSGVAIEVESDHALYPAYSAMLRGVSREAAWRVEQAARELFASVKRLA